MLSPRYDFVSFVNFLLSLLKGKVPFSLEVKNIPISESVEFLLVEFGTGNVVEACRPRNSKNTWFGHTPR